MKKGKLVTHISTFNETSATVRGKDLVNELIGEVSFTQMIHLHIMGRMPTASEARVLDAVLVTLIDHGMYSSLPARMVYTNSPESIQGAIATGLLGVGSQFGGVMEEIGRNLTNIVSAEDQGATAASIVAGYRAARRAIPGFGHPDFRPEDPRTPKLLAVAEREGVAGKFVAALRVMANAVDTNLGKHVTINATSALAALLGDLGVPWRIMRGFAVISRAPGIVGHLYEEIKNPVGMQAGMMMHEMIPYEAEQQG